MRTYILQGKVPVPIDDYQAWSTWFNTADRTVATDEIGGEWVSTVFVGFEYMLFETTRFGEDHESEIVARYATWEQAERDHHEIVRELRKQLTVQQ